MSYHLSEIILNVIIQRLINFNLFKDHVYSAKLAICLFWLILLKLENHINHSLHNILLSLAV